MEDIVRRRAEFLLAEARLNARRDQAVTFIMRVLSNHAAVGQDASSSLVKKLNKHVSLRACQALDQVQSFKEWSSETINDHPVPLKVSWNWLLENSNVLSVDDVWERFVQNPMMTIHKEEDRALNTAGLRSSGVASRYSTVGIKPLKLEISPLERFRIRTSM